jgi:hypothetical protein
MADVAMMDALDSVYGSTATCYVTLDGRRYNFMQMTEFRSKWEVTIKDIPILRKIGMGHKPAGGKGTWTGKAHFNQSHLRAVADTYQKTGVFPYFEIQVTNEDPNTKIGRQTVIHRDCLFNSVDLAAFQAGDEFLTEDLSGTFESFDLPEKFTDLEGI